MLTPRFSLKQDDQFVYLTIHAPYSNIKDNECLIEDYDFIFFASPYFLRVRLPGKLKDSDLCVGAFDCNDQTYSIKIEKENHGEFFENLDTITNLLIPCSPLKSKFDDKIEVISTTNFVEDDETESNCENQNVLHSNGYGFGNKINSKFTTYDTFLEVFDFSPDVIIENREEKRLEIENAAFSSDHYLADLYDTEYIDEYIKFIGPWQKHLEEKYVHQLSGSEIDILKELPNKEYIFSSVEKKQILVGILDILYPYLYELRTTANDLNTESSWTVNKLSSTLCCFATFDTVEKTIISLLRRSLIYPLYRNYDLSLTVLNDVKVILELGKVYVIKLFTEIHSLFNGSQSCRYILNDLYIKDYLIYLQKLNENDIQYLLSELKSIQISKEKLCLELTELEEAAEIVKNENVKDYEEIIHLMSKCNKLTIESTDSDDSSDDSTDETDDDNTSDTESSINNNEMENYDCKLYANASAK